MLYIRTRMVSGYIIRRGGFIMKKTLLFGAALLLGSTACAETQDTTTPQEETHRSIVLLVPDSDTKMTFSEKCVLGGKGLGAGTLSTMLTACCTYCILGAKNTDCLFNAKASYLEKGKLACLVMVTALLAVKTAGYSLDSFKAALKG